MITSPLRLSILFASLILLLTTSCQQTKDASATSNYEDINVAQFKEKMVASDIVVLDVRTPEETAEGMIDGAVEIDFRDDNFKDKVSQLDKDKTYLIYCRSGGRSASTCEIMQEMGFEKLYNLEGGYTRWSAETK